MSVRRDVWHYITIAGLMATIGCGVVGDRDRLPMARIGDREITRGDMRMAVRKMPPEEKPSIRTKGDVRSALNSYLDDELQRLEAAKLAESGEISADPDVAAQRYFAKNPDIMDVREIGSVSELPVAITEAELDNMKEAIDLGIEMEQRAMLSDIAMGYLVRQAYQTGRYEISDSEWEREYSIQKTNLMHPPRAKLKGVAFPAVDESAAQAAAEFRQRIDQGADFDDLLAEYAATNRGAPIEQEMQYDPNVPQLQSVWETIQGASAGTIFGPVSIAPRTVTVQDEAGNPRQQPIPPTFLVGKVLSYTEPTQMTLEESKPVLASSVLYVRVMEELRQKYDVEVIEKNLYTPDAAAVGGAGPVRDPSQQQTLTQQPQ